MKIKTLIFTLILTFVAFYSQAQKYGYLNSSQIIMIHPDIKAADQKLINFQNDLISQGEEMARKLESNYNAYVTEANKGTLTQIQMQEKETALGQEQQAIRQFEVEMQQKILKKREELYQPVLNLIQKAVEEVGKENSYMMIFDTSTGGILHAGDTDNVLELVKKKLNL